VTPHYARAAAAWLAGAELYSQDGRGFLYFPQAAMLYAPFLRLPDLARELAWRSAMVGLFACGVAGLCRLARPGAWGKEFCFVSLVAMPLAWSCARNGQTTLALAGLAMLAACSLARGRLWRSAALLALSAAFKPLGVVVACLACFARRGLWLRVLAMMVLAAAIPLALKDPRYVAAQYKACAAMLAAAMHLGVTRTWAQLFGLATTAGFSIAPEVQLAVRLLAAACLGVLICRLRCRLPPGRAAFYLYALTTLYLLLFNPRTENNSYAMLGPSLGVALAETWRTPGSIWRLLLLVAVGAGALGSFEVGRTVLPGVRPVWVAPVMGLLFAADLLARLAVEVRRNSSLELDVARRVGGAPAVGAGREDQPPSAGARAPASLVESA